MIPNAPWFEHLSSATCIYSAGYGKNQSGKSLASKSERALVSIVYIAITFAVIVLLMALRRPLWLSVCGGLVAMALLFQIWPLDCLRCALNVFTTESSLSLLVSLYLITYLQRMLEARNQLKAAGRDLDGLLRNQRASAIGSSVLIGLLPSPVAVLICGDLMKDYCGTHLTNEEQAFTTNWLRHIPESIMPTFPAVLLMSQLAGVELPLFMAGMIIPCIVIALIGYLPYLRKIPRRPENSPDGSRPRCLLSLFKHLWSILLILVLIIAFHLPIVASVLISIALCIPVYKFKPSELVPMLKTAFEAKMMVNIYLVLVLAQFIAFTGVLADIPAALSVLPVPAYLVFCLVFFFCCLIGGATGTIAMGTPLAYAAIPGGGMPLMVLLMCIQHAASQLQPTHVCLVMISEFYNVSLGALIKKTVVWALIFIAFAIAYYNVLTLLPI